MHKEDSFESLRNELNKNSSWPMVYMFKFIIPADNKKIALVESRFSEEAIISQQSSSKGNYISITVKEAMLSADSIIDKYKEMSDIEGLIAI